MLVKYHRAPVPFRSVIQDLVTRDGMPGSDNYPFIGMAEIIMKKARNTPKAVVFERLCSFNKDYDFTHPSRDYPNGYPATTIDEVPPNLVETYITQVLYNIVNYNVGGVREYSSHNSREQRSMRDNESGDVIYESELLMEQQDYTYEEYLAWKKQLPYLVKRMHVKSVNTGFHVMSAIRARALCYRDKVKVTPKNLIDRKIFTCDENGDMRGLVMENSGQFQQYFGRWIRGREEVRDSYYDDMQELCYICSRLGIDLANENPVRYGSHFVKTLVSDYIIKNSKVLVSAACELAGGGLPPQVRRIITNMSLDDLDSLTSLVSETETRSVKMSLASSIEHVQLMFMNSSLYGNLTDQVLSRGSLDEFVLLYYRCTHQFIDTKRLTVINDYVSYSAVELLTVHVAPFVTDNPGLGTSALLHRSGYFLLYHTERLNQSFAYIHIDRLCSFMRQYLKASSERRPLLNFRWEVFENDL